MRWLALLLLLPGLVASECQYVTLVKCFIQVLDDWAWTLYESKDNVVTISDQGCEHFNVIRQCINDKDTVHSGHGCNQAEVIETSRTVSDLLTHRKHSGTFLKSYYLLEYACTDGRQEVVAHKECLKKEAVGEQTLSAASYLEEKLKQADATADAWCSLLTTKLIDFREIISQQNLCGGEAERLMCESLKRMFTNVEPQMLGNCNFDCNYPNGVAPEGPVETVQSQPGSQEGLNGNANHASAVLSSLLLLFIATLLSL